MIYKLVTGHQWRMIDAELELLTGVNKLLTGSLVQKPGFSQTQLSAI